jgi:hypothetical protein
MSMNICGYKFAGPFSVETTIVPVNRAAVYVIVYSSPDGESYIRDVGLSDEQYWDRNNYDGAVSLYLRHMPSIEGYTSQDRQVLERKIRESYNIP